MPCIEESINAENMSVLLQIFGIDIGANWIRELMSSYLAAFLLF